MEVEDKGEAKPVKSPASNNKNKQRASLRFHLQLTGSSDRSFPEFSYLELIGSNKKKKKDDVLQQDDDNCNMDELRALAKKFEDKYAPRGALKSKKSTKTDRVEDLVDVTYGYDTTDAFVDDSEAYDELVPADWTTEHGGFYINMGELNFRPLSSGDEKSDNDFKDSKKKPTKKKMKEHKESKIKEGKRCLSSEEKEKNVKKMKLSSEVKEKKPKLKKLLSNGGKSNDSMNIPVGTVRNITTDKPSLSHDVPMSDKTTSFSALTLQSPVVKNNVTGILNSTSNNSAEMPMTSSYSGNEGDNNSSVLGSPSVTLPEGLPPSLILSIQKLIEAARKAGGDGKCKFFNMDVNRILLQIETDSRKLNCRARSAVYDYLALFLPCTKETLLKRAKNLFMQEQVGRLREPLTTLRHAVEAAMPEQIKHYEEEMAKHSEDQATQSQKPCSDVVSQNGEKKDEPGAKVIVVEGESDKTEEATTPTDVNAPATAVEEKGKRIIVPKRFVWKEDIRTRLCDVVRVKVELYLMSKSRSTTAEEALKGFLETEVRPIWPKGWMTTRILYRESKQAHAKVTSTLVAKAKKVLKKPKEDENPAVAANPAVTAKSEPQIKMEPNFKVVGEEKKTENNTTSTPAVSIPNGSVSSVVKIVVKQNLINPPLNQTPTITCSSLLNSTTTKPKVTGKTILDLLESSPGRNTQAKTITVESKPIVNQVEKITVITAASNALPSCSFQGLSSKPLSQFTPPRTIKPPISVQNSLPSRSSPSRIPAVNIASARQVSSVPGTFKPASPVTTKRMPSCSLMSSPTLPTQSKTEVPPSPVSPRQNYNFINKLPSSPSLGYKFQLQPPNISNNIMENIQRTTHSNHLSTNFLDLAPKSITPLSSSSLLSSIARSSVPQNHASSNSPLLRPPPLPNPSSMTHSLQDMGASLNTNGINIPPIVGISNNVIQNKPLKVHGVFPSGINSFSGLPQQFANQPVMHRTIPAKELKEGNNISSSYPPTYRPPFS